MSRGKKKNHGRQGPKRRPHPIQQGDSRHTVIAHKEGNYVTVRVEYKSIARDGQHVAEHILQGMIGAASTADRQVLAVQRKDEIIEGEILTPDGTAVVERWIPEPDELIVLKSRTASLEDLRDLPRYGEDEAGRDARFEEATRRIKERDAGAASVES